MRGVVGDPDERQRPITLVHERGQLGAGVTVQGRGVPDREQVMAAVMGDIDRLAGRRVGIELSGQPTIAPQGGADEPASDQDLSEGESLGHDAVPVLVMPITDTTGSSLARRRRTLNVCRGSASHISPAATSRSKAGGSDRN